MVCYELVKKRKLQKGSVMGQIHVEKTDIEGLCIITPTVHKDSRGYFMESYNERDFKEAGLDLTFVQDNQSMSQKGVLRGLHFQKEFILTEENKKMFYIPEGFAHGFLVLSDFAEFAYKVTDFYHPGDEGGLAWNDPSIRIEWPELKGEYRGNAHKDGYHMEDGSPLILSEKDELWLPLKDTFAF